MKKNSKAGGIVGGLIILIVGIGLLWYNEGRTVKTAQAIGEAKKNYIQVKSDKVDSKNEGKLIATNGKVDLSESNELIDEIFGVKAKSAKLQRTVEMFQWTEECTTDENDHENCTYKKEWKDELVDSSEFREGGHTNPSSMPYESEEYLADNVKVGSFTLTKELQSRLSTKKTIGNDLLKEQFANRVEGLRVDSKYLTNVAEGGTPEIGNIRVSFGYNDADSLSILAVQTDNSFSAYVAKSGKEVYRIKEGTHTGEVILKDMTDENNFMKWLLRFIGTLMVIGGIGSLFAPIQKLANYVPILGGLVSYATGLVSFVLGLAISLLVIALAWFRFRPVLSIILIVIVVALIVALKVMPKKDVKTKLDTKAE